MSKFLFAFLALIPLAGCGFRGFHGLGAAVNGSGRASTETRTVGKFDRVSVEGSVDCEVTIGPEQSVTVTTDDNLQKYVVVELRGSTLHIHQTGSTSTHIGTKVKIAAPDLASYNVSGSGAAAITGVKGSKFVASVEGSGDVIASGAADRLEVSISGSGSANCKGLSVKSASVSISGSGDAQVRASEDLVASIAGSGNITYFGNPKVERSIVGSGGVNKGS